MMHLRKNKQVARQDGVVLIMVLVFLLLGSLIALGDVSTLATQEKMVANQYDRARQLAFTENALVSKEAEVVSQAPANTRFPASVPTGGVNGSTNYAACNTRVSDTSPCSAGYCSQPTAGCLARWKDSNFASWLSFSEPLETSTLISGNNYVMTTITSRSLVEYLGQFPCVLGDAVISNCPVYRITVRNTPASALHAQVMLQSTYLVKGGVGQRLSWREVLPD
jgi:Tfp pilus assembly protein PilX